MMTTSRSAYNGRRQARPHDPNGGSKLGTFYITFAQLIFDLGTPDLLRTSLSRGYLYVRSDLGWTHITGTCERYTTALKITLLISVASRFRSASGDRERFSLDLSDCTATGIFRVKRNPALCFACRLPCSKSMLFTGMFARSSRRDRSRVLLCKDITLTPELSDEKSRQCQ